MNQEVDWIDRATLVISEKIKNRDLQIVWKFILRDHRESTMLLEFLQLIQNILRETREATARLQLSSLLWCLDARTIGIYSVSRD